jgi:hypothetical protein
MSEHTIASDMQKISSDLDSIFYFVSPENLMLKRGKMHELAQKFADALGISLYGCRCGPDVQDPKTLLEELNGISIEKFEIICFSREDGDTSLISHDQKVQFMHDLAMSTNTGLIAQKIIFGTDCIIL